MAMYFRPRARAASAIWRMVSRPSVASVCMWRSPRMSARVMRCGRVWAAAAFELAGVFTELRCNVVEIKGVVDVGLGGSGDDNVVFDAEQGVLVQREAALD